MLSQPEVVIGVIRKAAAAVQTADKRDEQNEHVELVASLQVAPEMTFRICLKILDLCDKLLVAYPRRVPTEASFAIAVEPGRALPAFGPKQREKTLVERRIVSSLVAPIDVAARSIAELRVT